MKKMVILILCWGAYLSGFGKEYALASPDKNIRATIYIGKDVRYAVDYKDNTYLLPSAIAMFLGDGKILGKDPEIRKKRIRSVDNLLTPLYGINRRVREHYNELRLDFRGDYAIVFRAYNEGFAWRFITDLPGDLIVNAEQSDFQFSGNYTAYFHPALSESFYRKQPISDFQQPPNYSSLPMLVKAPDSVNILIHESDVLNYPCLTLSADTIHTGLLVGNHALYPKVCEPGGYKNFNLVVRENEKFIARTSGHRKFPWRIIAFEEKDKDILENQLVYLLASANKLEEVSWIKPGKVAWDWWNALNLSGVPFPTGFNMKTYKFYIDFAAENGIEYVNLDEGWSDQFDLLNTTDKLDIGELSRYAKSKGVGLFLWCVWWTLDRQMEEALDQFEKWGIAGLKVDFMDRDDQVVVEFHERLLREAAQRKMLVNYHGAYHPTGMERTYPNNINVEGVRGLEWNKFDPQGTTPEHDVMIPFIRMFAGRMDYTPGAMRNFNAKDWKQIFDRPMSQGTRCHQLAMYIVYFAPLQMLSDAPTAYQKEPAFLKFLTEIPTTWDEVVPLQSAVGDYVCVARRKGDTWYIGAMTDWQRRELEIKLDFLDSQADYNAEIFTDGTNAARVGSDYRRTEEVVSKGDHVSIAMASGGGYVAKFSRIEK